MQWVERKLIRVANIWGVPEAMAATPTKTQIQGLNKLCLVESTLALWHEIGGSKLPKRMVKTTIADNKTTKSWETGFRIQHKHQWHPIETLQTQTIYGTLLEKQTKLRKYTPKTAHKNLHKIKKYLTPEERNYWWKLTHKIISIKRQKVNINETNPIT